MSTMLAVFLAFGAILVALRVAGKHAIADTTALDLLILLLLCGLTGAVVLGEMPAARVTLAAGMLVLTDRLLACLLLAR